MSVILITANFKFRNHSTCSKGPIKRAGKVCGDSQDLKSPGNDYQPPSEWNQCKTAYLVDVMANLRRVRTKQLKTFGEFCESFLVMILNICKNASRTDLVFDTYMEGSVKDTERPGRSKSKLLTSAKYERTHYYLLKWKHFGNRS